MSFDDYAEHINQKHRLCIAIAVLKAKPPDLTSAEYIRQLQSKMADNMDDDDITVCSEDFMMDDEDSVNILKGFDERRTGDLVTDEVFGVLNDRMEANSVDESNTNLPKNLTQSTYCPSIQSQIELSINNDATFYENYLTNGKENLPKDIEKHSNTKSNLSDQEFNTAVHDNCASHNTLFSNESNINKTTNKNEPNQPTDSNIDTQKTILYTVHGFTQNNTHCSPSQNDIIIPHKYLFRANEGRCKTTVATDANCNNVASAESNDVTNLNSTPNTNKENNKQKYIDNKNKSKVKVVSEDNTPENILTNQNVTEFSQNIDEIFQENESDLIENTLTGFNNDCNKNNVLKRNLDYSQNVNDYFNEIHNLGTRINFNDIDNENIVKTNNLKDTFELTQTLKSLSQENIYTDNLDANTNYDLDTTQNVDSSKHKKEIILNLSKEKCTQNFGPKMNSRRQNNNETAPCETIDEESDTAEIIPYKVLEELNKVKIFLRRRDRTLSCDGYSTDSGYRSDSQLRSSNRSALQLSGMSINQSAYCLFNHILQCPLVSATREITKEIAQTLGQLIDRLHEEETYPPFLEELLDTVDILLRQVYKGQGCDDGEFLKKDEFVQRILLLNNCIHIQSHSIDKIINILTKFHEKITDSNVTYELTNINEVENAAYFFHILEILLKKYIISKDTLSQSSQLSQDEEKILNKSSITDIWRKKWNPNFKEPSVGSRENRCVLKTCSEILNKIIVDCVNSYSLVAYSALKCFNSMQS